MKKSGDSIIVRQEPHVSKKCPYCYVHMKLEAETCPSCKRKVGMIDKHGMATRRIEWGKYIICILSWLTLAVYIKFAFL